MILLSTLMLLALLISITSTGIEAFTSVYTTTNSVNHRENGRHSTSLNVDSEVVVGIVAAAGVVTWWLSGAEGRSNRAKYAEWEAKERVS